MNFIVPPKKLAKCKKSDKGDFALSNVQGEGDGDEEDMEVLGLKDFLYHFPTWYTKLW